MSDINLPKSKKQPKKTKSELEHISDVLELMKQSGVHKFKYKDIEVEFEIETLGRTVPDTIDDETERLKALKKAIREEADDETANLTWSV